MHVKYPCNLVGRTFLLPKEHRQFVWATIFKTADDYESCLKTDSSRIKFVFHEKDNQVKDAFTCNKILEYKKSEDDNLIR